MIILAVSALLWFTAGWPVALAFVIGVLIGGALNELHHVKREYPT